MGNEGELIFEVIPHKKEFTIAAKIASDVLNRMAMLPDFDYLIREWQRVILMKSYEVMKEIEFQHRDGVIKRMRDEL